VLAPLQPNTKDAEAKMANGKRNSLDSMAMPYFSLIVDTVSGMRIKSNVSELRRASLKDVL
jgi:hypothetical protein